MASTSGPISNLLSWTWRLAVGWLLVVFVFSTQEGFGQTSARELRIAAAPVVYNNPEYDSLAVIEFPFVFSRNSLDFYRPDSTDSSSYGRIFAEVILYDTLAQPADTASTYFSVRVGDSRAAETTSVMIFNKLGMASRPGRYSARLTVIDAVSKRTGELFFPKIEVARPQRERLQVAGPVLAYKITYVTDSAQKAADWMIRSGFQILANPAGLFTQSDSTVHLYAEIYNLAETAELKPTYRLAFKMLDSLGTMVQDLGYVDRVKPGRSAAVAESFDIGGWQPGAYQLRMTVTDPATSQSDSATLPLAIVTARSTTHEMVAEQQVDPYDSLTLNEKINLAHYLLTPDQKVTLSRLNDQGKLNFLEQYWKEHDSDPATPVIENRVAMIARYRFANRYFSRLEGRTDGWSSDRGRIYMMYGPWDQRDDVPTPREGNPFSIWYYRELKEGKLFVFEDMKGDNEYTLVHSNVEGERFDKTWAERVKEEMLDIR